MSLYREGEQASSANVQLLKTRLCDRFTIKDNFEEPDYSPTTKLFYESR